MKVVLDLPEDVVAYGQALAAARSITLDQVVAERIGQPSVKRPPVQTSKGESLFANEHGRIEIDEHGFPVWKRFHPEGIVITSEMIYKMMDEEGI